MHQSYYDSEYIPSNREKTIAPKKGFGWCGGCDRVIIREWKKCPFCGRRNGRYRLKR